MPTENERKYVLRLDCEDEITCKHCSSYLLKQGYLAFAKGMTLRIRSAEELGKKHSKIKRKLCLKQRANSRVIEIEKKIGKRDFEDLWKMSLSRLEKVRHIIIEKGQVWEIDFFKLHHHDEDETYFALAEHEMPEGQISPDFIPDIIARHLLYAVPPNEDYEFSSKRLACVRHAKKLYRDLTDEEVKEERAGKTT